MSFCFNSDSLEYEGAGTPQRPGAAVPALNFPDKLSRSLLSQYATARVDMEVGTGVVPNCNDFTTWIGPTSSGLSERSQYRPRSFKRGRLCRTVAGVGGGSAGRGGEEGGGGTSRTGSLSGTRTGCEREVLPKSSTGAGDSDLGTSGRGKSSLDIGLGVVSSGIDAGRG